MHELVHVPAMLYVVIAYLVVIMLVGGYFYSKEKKAGNNSHEEFLLAGRSLGKIVIIGTIFATYLGGGTVTGGGNSLAYEFGIWPSICFAIPPIISLSVLLLMSERSETADVSPSQNCLRKNSAARQGRYPRLSSPYLLSLLYLSSTADSASSSAQLPEYRSAPAR